MDDVVALNGDPRWPLEGQDGQVGIRVALGGSEDAPLITQLQIDATLAAYGQIFPASAPQPVFEEVLAEWRDRLGGDTTTGQAVLVAIDDGRLVGVVVAGPDLDATGPWSHRPLLCRP